MIKRIQSYLKTKLGIDELAFIQKRQELKIEFLTAYINLVNSDHLSIPEDIEKGVVKEVVQNFGISDFDATIHKNDIMFAGMLISNPTDLKGVLYSYFKIGVSTANNIHTILKEHGVEPGRILDFGSGYGRVARFLPAVFPAADVFVSDVKTSGTNFLRQRMGLGQVVHSEDPSSFPQQKFDVIFALSVFTHLPKTTFKAWMDVLINSVAPGGVLIFTFNHIKDAPNPKGDFHYITQSEEKKFAAMADTINDEEQYGSTWVSHEFLLNILKEHGAEHSDLQRTFVKTQNAFVVCKV